MQVIRCDASSEVGHTYSYFIFSLQLCVSLVKSAFSSGFRREGVELGDWLPYWWMIR